MPVRFEKTLVEEVPSAAEEFRRKNRFKQVKFSIYLLAFQLSLLCLFVRFATYSVRADAAVMENGISVAFGGGAGRTEAEQLLKNLTFMILLVVIFIGSCCSLMKFQHFSTGGQIINLVVISTGFQWSLLCRGLLYFAFQVDDVNMIRIDVHDLTEALLAVLSLLIASSFVLGRIAPVNVLAVVLLHVPLYNVAKVLNEEVLLATDPGSALPIHLFGAVFGWTMHAVALRERVSTVITDDVDRPSKQVHEGNLFAYIGSAVLFVGLPFLNGIVSESDAEMTRSVINTILSATSSLMSSFTLSVGIAHLRDKPVSSHVLHGALLSGGVAVGGVATLMLQPFGALAVGSLTGILTSASYVFLEPYVRKALNLPCSCGVLSFHGVSAFISGLVGVLMALLSEDSFGSIVYNESLYPIYPARVPKVNVCNNRTCSSGLGEIISNYPFLEEKAKSRSALEQSAYQAVGLLLVLALASAGGVLNGALLRFSAVKCGNPLPSTAWLDESFIINAHTERKNGAGRQSNYPGEKEHETLL